MAEAPWLPREWQQCTVADAGVAIVGQQRTPAAAQNPVQSPYLRVANVFDDVIDLEDVTTMHFSEDAKERYLLRAGDVLLCEGQSRELVGRAAIFRGEMGELYFQNHIIRFRPHAAIIPEYALLVFRAYQHSGVFAREAKGTTNIVNLGLRRFQALPFPVPPRLVQQQLVELARSCQDLIDSCIDGLTSAREVGAALPQKVRDAVILGNYTGSEIPTPIPNVEWQPASKVVAEDSPIVYGILQPGPNIEDETGVPYVRGQDLQDGEILEEQLRRTSPAIALKYSRSSLAPGDVLLGIIRHTRVAVVPPELEGANITQGTARLRPNQEKLDSAYLAHWLASGTAQAWLRSHMRGIDMPGLNLGDVRKLPVPCRTIAEQRAMSDVLDEAIAHLSRLLRHADDTLSRLRMLERSMTQALSYGELAVQISKDLMGEGLPHASTLTLRDLKAATSAKVVTSRLPKKVASRQAEVSVDRRRAQMPTESAAFVAALQATGSQMAPEELYAALGLRDEQVDEFFAMLRGLEQDGTVRIQRPDNTAVTIELAQ